MTATAIRLDALPRAAVRPSCPLCVRPAAEVFLTRAEVAAELAARDQFFDRRFDHRRSRHELRDLTDVLLGTPAAILRCTGCGMLVRDEVPGDAAFRDDQYDDRVLEGLHQLHARAFEAKELDYRPLLPPSARVVEIGSYVGGFLSTAAKWGWRATGVDIGRDPVRFCRALGLDVQFLRFEECALDARSVDALFVWNCFEQLAEPAPMLARAHRVLRERGLLIIRVPDADFYVHGRQQGALALLAYNSLLGWPHRFGYDAGTLCRLAERHAFTFVRALRRPAMRPLREAMHSWAREEEARLAEDAGDGWLELTFTKR